MTLMSFSRLHQHFETQILIEKSLCAHYLLNEWLEFHQTSTDKSLGPIHKITPNAVMIFLARIKILISILLNILAHLCIYKDELMLYPGIVVQVRSIVTADLFTFKDLAFILRFWA